MNENYGSKRNFFKNYSYDITKLFINQIGITIFSLVLYTAVGSIKDESLSAKITTVMSVFAVIFFYSLLYTAAWDFGARDKIRIDGGKLEGSVFTGLKMSLIANIPNFALAFLSTLFIGLYIVTGVDGFYTAFGIFNLLLRFLCAMFIGVLQAVFSFLATADGDSQQALIYFFCQSVGYLVVPTLTVGITHLGYTLGFKEKRILKFMAPEKRAK